MTDARSPTRTHWPTNAAAGGADARHRLRHNMTSIRALLRPKARPETVE